jgi:hypothetical protein
MQRCQRSLVRRHVTERGRATPDSARPQVEVAATPHAARRARRPPEDDFGSASAPHLNEGTLGLRRLSRVRWDRATCVEGAGSASYVHGGRSMHANRRRLSSIRRA